jgi:DNA-binding transcriptional LysR family regulator
MGRGRRFLILARTLARLDTLPGNVSISDQLPDIEVDDSEDIVNDLVEGQADLALEPEPNHDAASPEGDSGLRGFSTKDAPHPRRPNQLMREARKNLVYSSWEEDREKRRVVNHS